MLLRWLPCLLVAWALACPAHGGPLLEKARNLRKPRVIAVWLWGDNQDANATLAQKERTLLDLVTQTQLQREFFHRAQGYGINRIYLNVNLSPDGGFLFSDRRESLASFIRRAHQQGIQVFALFGDPAYVPREAHSRIVGTTGLLEALLAFNSLYAPGFDGVQSDVEPYYDPQTGSPTDLAVVGPPYLELNAAIAKRIIGYREVSGRSFEFEAAIPFWYAFPSDEGHPPTRIEFDGRHATLDEHILHAVDAVAVMAYRDLAEGKNGVISLAQPTIDLAERLGKRVLVALETQKPHPQFGVTPHITLFEEGFSGLRRVVGKVDAHFRNSPSYQGIAIHHYDSLIYLGEGRPVEENLLKQGVLWTTAAATGLRLWDVSGNFGHYGNHARDNAITSGEAGGHLKIKIRSQGGWGGGVSLLFSQPEEGLFLDGGRFDAVSVTWCSDVAATLQLADARWHELDDSVPLGALPASAMRVQHRLLPVGQPHPVFATSVGDLPQYVYSGSDEYGWIDRSKLASMFLRFSPVQEGVFHLIDLRFVSSTSGAEKRPLSPGACSSVAEARGA